MWANELSDDVTKLKDRIPITTSNKTFYVRVLNDVTLDKIRKTFQKYRPIRFQLIAGPFFTKHFIYIEVQLKWEHVDGIWIIRDAQIVLADPLESNYMKEQWEEFSLLFIDAVQMAFQMTNTPKLMHCNNRRSFSWIPEQNDGNNCMYFAIACWLTRRGKYRFFRNASGQRIFSTNEALVLRHFVFHLIHTFKKGLIFSQELQVLPVDFTLLH